MNRAVFDTNVIVSGFLSPADPPGRIVEWLRSGIVQAVLDDRIAAEYAEVLARPRCGLPSAEVDIVLAAIRLEAARVEVGRDEEEVRGDDDEVSRSRAGGLASLSVSWGVMNRLPTAAALPGASVSRPAAGACSRASSGRERGPTT